MRSFRDVLEQMRGARVLVVGDLMLDEYLQGRATRISQEAPVMVIRQTSVGAVPGGAANVAANLTALGGIPFVVGVIGDDHDGERLCNSLAEAGMNSSGLVVDRSRPTTRKTRVLADGAHQVLRIDHELSAPVAPDVEKRLLAQIELRIAESNAVLLSDYRKGTLTNAAIRAVIERAAGAKMPVIANAKPDGLSNYRGATLVSLNQFEASQAAGDSDLMDLSETAQLHAAAMKVARELQDREQIGHVLVTLRGDGMATADFSIPPVRVEVSDEAGAGDTTIATVALGLASVGYCPEVFHLAAQTAAAVVQRVGVATPDAADLARIAAQTP